MENTIIKIVIGRRLTDEEFDKIREWLADFVKTFCAYYAPKKDDWCCNYISDLDERHFDVREVEVIE